MSVKSVYKKNCLFKIKVRKMFENTEAVAHTPWMSCFKKMQHSQEKN